MRLGVKVNKIDSELLLKSVSIRYRQIVVTTPVKASFNKLPQVGKINEIYRQIGSKTLSDCISDTKRAGTVNRGLKKGVNPSAINFFVINYPDDRLLNETQMQYLSNLQYVHSNVVVTPNWSEIIKQRTAAAVETFIGLTDDYITQVERLNNKTILGMIPVRTPFGRLKTMVDYYVNKDITSFVVDFDRLSIDTDPAWGRELTIQLNENDLMDSSFLYAVNASAGYFRGVNQTLAKDFVNCGFGVDVLGLNHIGGGPTRQKKDAWLFNEATYGYTKTPLSMGQQEIRDYQKEYNIGTQFRESLFLQQKLSREDTLEFYVKSKSQVNDKVIKDMKEYRSLVKR